MARVAAIYAAESTALVLGRVIQDRKLCVCGVVPPGLRQARRPSDSNK
jgi:hypothetical protein